MSDSPDTGTAETDLEARDALVAAMLPHVAFDGWSDTALRAGARDLGLAADDARALFPRGAREALGHFSRWADRRMVEDFAAADTSGLKMHEKIMLAVELRLNALGPYREAVRRGMSFLALPTNAPFGAKLLYRTVDDVWYAAGDRAADFSFYTKRGLLAGVIASTTLYWLEDASDDFADTHAFLERRIGDVMRLHKARGTADRFRSHVPNPFRAVRDVVSKRYRFG